MNFDAVKKRLEALEASAPGMVKHIECIQIWALNNQGEPCPCFNLENYSGKYLVRELIFEKVSGSWEYKPVETLIDSYKDYVPPDGYKGPVIYFIRRKRRCNPSVEEYAKEMVRTAETATKQTEIGMLQ